MLETTKYTYFFVHTQGCPPANPWITMKDNPFFSTQSMFRSEQNIENNNNQFWHHCYDLI